MKIVQDSIEPYLNEAVLDNNSIPIYRVRMVGDIEFTKKELEEYMSVNGLDSTDLKKAATGIAKVKWKNRVKAALDTSDTKEIDESNFKWNIK